jgi:hypothetical protein
MHLVLVVRQHHWITVLYAFLRVLFQKEYLTIGA